MVSCVGERWCVGVQDVPENVEPLRIENLLLPSEGPVSQVFMGLKLLVLACLTSS